MSKDNAYLGTGIDALFGDSGNPNEYEITVNLDDIEIEAQVREEFEDDENSLAELGLSLRNRQLQAIVVRPNRPGSDKPFLLVAGERRSRAARIEGLTQLRARVMELNDDEAEDMQLAENIHRKNLTQIEEAKKIQRDLDRLGSVDAVLKQHHKGRSWLSKTLSLLNLPDQAKRLVTENVSADIEVINTVKTIEKHAPEKAKELVDDLKKTRGKDNARNKVAAVKAQVKPSKNQKNKQEAQEGGDTRSSLNKVKEQPIFAGAKNDTTDLSTITESENDNISDSGVISPEEVLRWAYGNVVAGMNPNDVLNGWTDAERGDVEEWLTTFYNSGAKESNPGRKVIEGFRDGRFASNGAGAFALVAFIYGLEVLPRFDIIDVLSSVKPK